MAEGGSAASRGEKSLGKKNQLCRYFLLGSCSKGSSCTFIHDKSSSPDKLVCQYYLAGSCTYGEKCRFQHVKNSGKTKWAQPQGIHGSAKSKSQNRSGVETRTSKMVTLTKNGPVRRDDTSADYSSSSGSGSHLSSVRSWAQAKPFVPGQKFHSTVPGSYAEATASGVTDTAFGTPCTQGSDGSGEISGAWGGNFSHECLGLEPTGIGGLPDSCITVETPLCPYYALGECPYNDRCSYAHGDLCDMCGMPRLHPVNQKQREEHIKECLAEHEKDMELSFALQASEGQECGICLENVVTKEGGSGTSADRRFGILENCNHCFCLTCIRQWRGNKELSIETHRTCPTCRTHSDFITPSKYWVTSPEEKSKLIQDYKKALAAKPCQYFKKGKGECPFNTKCFYLHALPDGTVARENVVKRRWRTNADGEHAAQDDELSLWDFINQRDEGLGGAGIGLDLDLDDELSLLLMEILQNDSDDDDDIPGNTEWYGFSLEDFLRR